MWDLFFRVLLIQEMRFAPSHALITHFPTILRVSKKILQKMTVKLGMTEFRRNFYGPRNFYLQQKIFPDKILDLSFHWKKNLCPYDFLRIFSAAALFFSNSLRKPLASVKFKITEMGSGSCG